MKIILKHIKKYSLLFLLVIIFLTLQSFFNLLLPLYMSDIVDVGIQQYAKLILEETSPEIIETIKDEQMSYILLTGFKMLIIAVLTAMVASSVHLLNSLIGAGIGRDLRKSLFEKIESFSGTEFNNFSTASLITRTTYDIQNIQLLFTGGFRTIVFAPLMAFGGLIMIYNIAPTINIINSISISFVAVFFAIVFPAVTPKVRILQKLADKLNLITREMLTGVFVIRGFSTEDFEEERFDQTNSEIKKVNSFVSNVSGTIDPTINFVKTTVPIAIIYVGAQEIIKNNLEIGDIIAFIQFSGNIIQAFMMISGIFILVPNAMSSIKRVSEVLLVENKILDGDINDVDFDSCEIKFKDVTFTYDKGDKPSLNNINIDIKKGTTTAIIGSTGCGKTTILSLLLRLYDVDSGEVLINGVNVKKFNLKTLRNLIGYVPQASILFSGDINSNIKVGDYDAEQTEIERITKISQAYNFIKEKEFGFSSHISQSGANVSGGQKQRLCISRALIKKAPIYIFDDSFSALDYKTDLLLRTELDKNFSDKTFIVIAQRIATLIDADQIIVMDKGNIVGIGKHEELLNSCSEYAEIVASQQYS